jgi:hypothetical protein
MGGPASYLVQLGITSLLAHMLHYILAEKPF